MKENTDIVWWYEQFNNLSDKITNKNDTEKKNMELVIKKLKLADGRINEFLDRKKLEPLYKKVNMITIFLHNNKNKKPNDTDFKQFKKDLDEFKKLLKDSMKKYPSHDGYVWLIQRAAKGQEFIEKYEKKQKEKPKEEPKDFKIQVVDMMKLYNNNYSEENIKKQNFTKDNLKTYKNQAFELYDKINVLLKKIKHPIEFLRQYKDIMTSFNNNVENFTRRIKAQFKKAKPKK